MDFSLFYRQELNNYQNFTWDVFISSFNNSERIKKIFQKIVATEKKWLIHPEYGFSEKEIPSSDAIIIEGKSESSQIQSFDNQSDFRNYIGKSVCIDITGFMRPQLIIMLRYLHQLELKNVDFIYSEPSFYKSKENTQFSSGSVYQTRQISGFQGINKSSNKRDLIIILAGYDKNLIGRAAQFSDNADIVMLFGFPSLQPDMYQENILCTVESYDSVGDKPKDHIFSPAWDPFETASVINEYIVDNNCLQKYRHIYVCPLSTKAQTLGAGLAWIANYEKEPVSIIYPFTEKYHKETSTGIAKTWLYTIEFHNL